MSARQSAASSLGLDWLFIAGDCLLFVFKVVHFNTVSPLAGLLLFLMAEFAEPLLLSGVDVAYDCSILGALIAHQEATLSAVVSAFGGSKLARAAHAYLGHTVRNPGSGEDRARFAAASLQQTAAAVVDVLHPGMLFFI